MRLRWAALRRAAAMGSSTKSKPVTAWPRAAKNMACSPVPTTLSAAAWNAGWGLPMSQARERISLSSFLKRHAHTIGVNGAELFRTPRLGLQWTIRVHFSPAFLIFGIHGLDTLNGDSHHGLVSDLARQFFVAHTGYVQAGLAAVDSCVVRRRGIAKRFRKATDFHPPLQRFCRVSSRKNGDRSPNDRLHAHSITELQRA